MVVDCFKIEILLTTTAPQRFQKPTQDFLLVPKETLLFALDLRYASLPSIFTNKVLICLLLLTLKSGFRSRVLVACLVDYK